MSHGVEVLPIRKLFAVLGAALLVLASLCASVYAAVHVGSADKIYHPNKRPFKCVAGASN